jgi:tetratricopeptide (TPR) repeat protein
MTEITSRLSVALADRYTIDREIGAGGMATVFLARDLKHDRNVAIKVLDPDLAVVVGASRFLTEIKVTANLHHPHILPLYDSGEAGGLLYYVMPYVEGETLRQRLDREGRLPVHEAIAIARKVAAALDTAHQLGVVHRDVKPENILLRAGEPIVADFGIARAVTVSGEVKATRAGVAIGTPAYMSPEQAAARDVDHRTDVYALGAILYEMLIGEPPYAGATFEDIAAKRLFDPVPSVRRARDDVPPDADRAIARSLAKAPDDRFGSARAFADALGTASGEGVAVAPARGRQRTVWWSAAVLLTLVAMVAWWTARPRATSAPPSESIQVAVFPFTVRGSERIAYLAEGIVSLLSTKLDGAGTWRTVDPRAVLAAVGPAGGPVAEPGRGRTLARSLDAGLFVLGDIVEVGADLRIDASLYDGTGGPSSGAQASVEGAADSVLTLVDQLAAQLLVEAPAGAGERLTRIAAVTTTSLPALKAYLRGTKLLWNGRFAEAGDALREAVREDSTFALAWYQLSVAADWMLRADIAREAADQAVRFSDRLPERDRRLLEALRIVRLGRATEAEARYRAIVSTYPGDVEAWYQLSEVLFHFGPRLGRALSEARGPLLRLLELEPEQATARVHLARLAVADGDLAELDALVDEVRGLSAESRVPVELRMLRVLGHRDDRALDDLLAVIRSHPEGDLPELAWAAATFTGNPEGTRRVVSTLIEPHRSVEARAVGRVQLAHLRLAEGRWTAAAAQLDSAAHLDPDAALEHRALLATLPFLDVPVDDLQRLRQALAQPADPQPSASPLVWHSVHNELHPLLRAYLRGLISARLGDVRAVARHLRALDSLAAPVASGSLRGDLALGLRAAREVATGDTGSAAAVLDSLRLETWHQLNVASPFYSLARERFLRARAYQEAGRLDDAMRWYGTFTNTSLHDLVYLAPSHFHRGEIAELQGDVEGAAAHYRRVVELWEGADRELQRLLEEARGRLARLAPHP